MQNQKYVHSGGAKNNRTLAEARRAEAKLRLIGIPTYGVFAAAFGGGEYLAPADFDVNGIDMNLPFNAVIKISEGNGPDESGELNAIADFGGYRSVDMVLDAIERDRHPDVAIAMLLAETQPGITSEQVQQRLMALPGVAKAFGAAVRAAWDAA